MHKQRKYNEEEIDPNCSEVMDGKKLIITFSSFQKNKLNFFIILIF